MQFVLMQLALQANFLLYFKQTLLLSRGSFSAVSVILVAVSLFKYTTYTTLKAELLNSSKKALLML